MNLKGLSTEEMVVISTSWVDKKTPAGKAIDDEPAYKTAMGIIADAHQKLHATQPQSDDPRLKEITEEAAATDLRHDALVRGIHGLLTSAALIHSTLGNQEKADQYSGMLQVLLPEGLDAAQKTYLAQAGEAELVGSRLTPEHKKQLKQIDIAGVKLDTLVDDWRAAGRQLGELEKERASLVIGTRTDKERDTELTARNLWIRGVKALVANAELGKLDPETDKLLFSQLRKAEADAERRAKAKERRKKKTDPDPQPA